MIYLRLHGFNHVLVRSSVSVCVYRRHGRLDIAGAKERTEFFRRFVHEGGVESTADSERNNSSAGFGEFRFSIVQGFLCSRYRNLTGAVVVDGVESAVGCADFFHSFAVQLQNSRHSSFNAGIGTHEFTALADNTESFNIIKSTAERERGNFSERESCKSGGFNTVLFENQSRRKLCKIKSRLSVFGFL